MNRDTYFRVALACYVACAFTFTIGWRVGSKPTVALAVVSTVLALVCMVRNGDGDQEPVSAGSADSA